MDLLGPVAKAATFVPFDPFVPAADRKPMRC